MKHYIIKIDIIKNFTVSPINKYTLTNSFNKKLIFLIVFLFALIPLGKAWIHLYSSSYE